MEFGEDLGSLAAWQQLMARQDAHLEQLGRDLLHTQGQHGNIIPPPSDSDAARVETGGPISSSVDVDEAMRGLQAILQKERVQQEAAAADADEPSYDRSCRPLESQAQSTTTGNDASDPVHALTSERQFLYDQYKHEEQRRLEEKERKRLAAVAEAELQALEMQVIKNGIEAV